MSDISVKTITTFVVTRSVPDTQHIPTDGTSAPSLTEQYGPYSSIEIAGAVRDALVQRDASGLPAQ